MARAVAWTAVVIAVVISHLRKPASGFSASNPNTPVAPDATSRQIIAGPHSTGGDTENTPSRWRFYTGLSLVCVSLLLTTLAWAFYDAGTPGIPVVAQPQGAIKLYVPGGMNAHLRVGFGVRPDQSQFGTIDITLDGKIAPPEAVVVVDFSGDARPRDRRVFSSRGPSGFDRRIVSVPAEFQGPSSGVMMSLRPSQRTTLCCSSPSVYLW